MTGLDADGFEVVFALNPTTLDFAVVSRADTVLDQATGLDIEVLADWDSYGGTPSQDGTFATFLSIASNLLEATPTTLGRQHVYLRDLVGESNELISVGAARELGNESRILLPDTRPIPAANDDSTSAVLSGDGRFVVFATRATNIVPLAKNGLSQIYVYDRDFRAMELITRVAIGADVFPGNAQSFSPYVATTGRFVVYLSDATNLILETVPNAGRDVFIFDRTKRTTSRLMIDGRYLDPGPPIISEDGNVVVFSAQPQPPGARQIYVHNRAAATTTLVTKSVPGASGDGDSAAPALDQGGRFVVFQSDATNLVAGDTNGLTDIFVYDIGSDQTRRISVAFDATGAMVQPGGDTPSISPEGTLIAFVSRGLDLVGADGSLSIVEEEGELLIRGVPTPPQSRAQDLYVFGNPFLLP